MSEVETMGFSVEKLEIKTSKNGNEYARVYGNKKWFSAFDAGIVKALHEGGLYRAEVEVGEFNGRPSRTIRGVAEMDDNGTLGEWVRSARKGGGSQPNKNKDVAALERHFKMPASSAPVARENDDQRAGRIARAVALKAAVDLHLGLGGKSKDIDHDALIADAQQFMPYLLEGKLPVAESEGADDEVPFE